MFLGAPAAQVVGKIRELMPRDKVALLINSCAKKPKPRRVAAVAPSAPRPAQRSEHIDDALMATKRRRVAFGDVSIHVFPMAIADNPAVRSGVALGLGRGAGGRRRRGR